jgi:hypothetical protein
MWNNLLLLVVLIGGLGWTGYDALKDRSPRAPEMEWWHNRPVIDWWAEKRTNKEKRMLKIKLKSER